MSGIPGLRSTSDWGVDERPKNFREGILRFNPSGTAPIFALSSQSQRKSKSVDDPEFAWWSEGNVLTRLQVNGALGAGDTTVVVDSADPTITTMGANRGTATNLKAGDLLLVEPSADNATFNHELVEVVSVLSDTTFTVTRGAGGTTAASIGNDAWLLLMGSAYAEGTGVPRAVSRNPIKSFNYTQIFKDTYELTGTADETRTRTGNDWSEDKKRKMWDHSQKIEWSMLFGRPAETTGENGKPKRFMGGIRYFLPSTNVTVFSSAVTPATFAAALAPVFDFESTGAGDTRVGFAGTEALLQLGLVFQDVDNGYRFYGNDSNVVKAFGFNFQEFQTPNGRLLIKSHPLMSRHPIFKKGMFVIDFDALRYVYMKNRDTKSHDDVQTKDEDVRRGFIMTECSIELAYGGLTMGYLGNISAT
jgi:hypothetical protein